MSRVFLATEASLRRSVVIKILPPEFASDVSAARFTQEIELAAHLQHPNILPVLSAGASEGLLYYIMPYVTGESLRHRLTREGKLSLADAARILHEVADALTHAHGQGVIHRDIKPENILLEGGHAVLTDFGVSRALAASRSGGALTETGMAVGTPGYMSPEQVAGERNVDARVDVYALAVVGYEMLAGKPPFEGPTAQAVLAAHLTEPPRPIRQLRPDVPPRLEAALATALAKTPDERYRSAAEFRDAIGIGLATEAGVPRRRVVIGAAAAIAVVIVAVTMLARRDSTSGPLDANVVTMLPFRVSGADPSLEYLREGMVDLLAAKLTGEGGPRAVDPRTALAAWRRAGGSTENDLTQDEAVQVARGLRSGRVLLGEIVGTGQRLVINASLVPVTGLARPERTSIEGSPDSLLPLVDHLAARLLALDAGEGQRLDVATSTSLPALRAYLDGRAAYRRGRYLDAIGQFERALALDSGFALASMGLYSTAFWVTGRGDAVLRALRLGTTHRERLGARDRLLLAAWAGPGYPAPSTERELLEAWERAVEAMPDQPEVWYWAGDQLFHVGSTLDIGDWRERARDAFERAAAFDSTFSGPLQHLTDVAAAARDREAAMRWSRLFFAADSAADNADYVRWRVAVASGDEARVEALRARFDRMSENNLRRILGWTQVDGVALDDAPQVFQGWRHALVQPGVPNFAVYYGWAYLHNAGRPAEATALLRDRLGSAAADDAAIGSALYISGDSVAAAGAATRQEPALGPASRDTLERQAQYGRACTLARWYVAVGDNERASRLRARAQAYATVRDRDLPTLTQLCWVAVDALLGAAEGRPEWRGAVRRLDSLSATGGIGATGAPFPVTPTLDLALLLERAGDVRGALTTVRRRPYHQHTTTYLATHLREEGRLAALAGDTAAAIAAYSHYLALRPNPEPSVAPEVEQVRGELGRLTKERR
ncbi:MAG: protein kinase [Gemmatimonadetes bacterium]|nr:protein kinase [Gemmatimonadota bacterium]